MKKAFPSIDILSFKTSLFWYGVQRRIHITTKSCKPMRPDPRYHWYCWSLTGTSLPVNFLKAVRIPSETVHFVGRACQFS